MRPEDALTWIRDRTPDATLEQAAAFLALAEDRGLTPFVECHPIFTAKREKVNNKWVTTGKTVGLKEHYNIAARWAQQSGGYSTPIVETVRETRKIKEYDEQARRQVLVDKPGVKVRIGVLTNRDYAALIDLAGRNIPGFDFKEERQSFLKWGEAWVADDHSAPSGKDATWVARKRATEEALLNAFGREPSQARQMYQAALTVEDHGDAVAALYGDPAPARAALPAPAPEPPAVKVVDAVLTDNEAPEWDEEADAEAVAKIAIKSLAADEGSPFTTPEAAISWGAASGAFGSGNGAGPHARAAYNKLKAEHLPKDAAEMARLWRADVARRLAEQTRTES